MASFKKQLNLSNGSRKTKIYVEDLLFCPQLVHILKGFSTRHILKVCIEPLPSHLLTDLSVNFNIVK
ncbi:hypothetical protein, partial [Mycoplasmoides pneumoniae]|uniref:hypothetical protein n=1 Tax=Mycoplasmoides pneumoniae TaxID=2104 RepID=UPI001F242154